MALYHFIIALVSFTLAYYWLPATRHIMAAGGQRAELVFGEIIDKRLFEKDLVETASQLRAKNQSVYDLNAAKREMSPKMDKYVFINIYQMHASIVVSDEELFDTLLFEPVWGQMINGPKLQMRQDDAYRRMATTIPLKQYHVCLDKNKKNYILKYNMYYFDWLLTSRSYYVGESAMAYLYLQLLSLSVVPERYRLLASDCLEFAKNFAKEVAIRENGVREMEVQALFTTLSVSEQYYSATLEQSSRNNPESAFSVAVSYFMSFKPERLLIAVVLVVILGIVSKCFLSFYDK